MFTPRFPWEAPNDSVEVQFWLLLGQLFGLWGPAGPSGGPKSHSGGPWKAIWGPRKLFWGPLEDHLGAQKAMWGSLGGQNACFGNFGVHFGVSSGPPEEAFLGGCMSVF